MSAFALVLLLSVGQTEPIDLAPAEPIATPKIAVDVDYVYWFIRKMAVPPLLSTGPAGSTATIGQPGTQIIYGGDRLDSRHDDRYIGVRFGVDWWLDDARTFAIHGSAFFLERDSSYATVPWHSLTPLARPYVDATTGAFQSLVVAGPSPGVGDLSGAINLYSRIELFGQDLGGLWVLARGENWSLGGILGAKFLQMRERLDITSTSRLLPGETTLFGLTDHIHTFDKFYGGQAGFTLDYRPSERWSIRLQATAALGADDQKIHTFGDQVFQTPLVRTTKDYGLYVLPSNRGNFERCDFDTVEEMSLSIGWDVSRHVSLHLGYSVLLWTNPVRPGDQIAPINLTQVSPTGLVGPPLPQIPWRTDLVWVHGARVGLEFHW